VYLGPKRHLSDAALEARFDGRNWRLFSLEARVGETGRLNIDYRPRSEGIVLEARSDDAGETFRAFDWSHKLEGGTITVTAVRRDVDAPLEGTFQIKGYKVSKAPLLARLLQVASLTGIIDVLGTRGLDFVTFDGAFRYNDGLLKIAKSRTFGSSLGITVEGSLDLDDDRADLKGTVVPAYTVNRVLGKIPILGPLLTGGKDEGVFAATYVVTGPLDNPKVKVNPLTALAPGFLRNLFGAIGKAGRPPPEEPSSTPVTQ
jgi:hypothetical protein